MSKPLIVVEIETLCPDMDAEDVAKLAQAMRGYIHTAVIEEREACAETCIRIWREASNERTDSALTSYRQNAISHGCVASAEAIRARNAA